MDFFSNEQHRTALLLSLISGLSTGIGGLFVICFGQPSQRSTGFMLGFASGVMLYVSFLDLIPSTFVEIGAPLTALAFIIGFAIMHLIVKWIPSEYDAHDDISNNGIIGNNNQSAVDAKLFVTGLVVVAGISIHNFPEGMAVFLSTMNGWKMGMTIAIAIGLHNFPEGMAVASPIYAATKSKWTAIKWSLISGLCEPLGALAFGLFFHHFMDRFAISFLLASVSGVMTYVCVKELIPNSLEYAGRIILVVSNIFGAIVLYTCSTLLEGYSEM